MRMTPEAAASSGKCWLNIYAEQKAVREATSAAADGKDTQLTANRGGWKVAGAVVGKLTELYALFFLFQLWNVRRFGLLHHPLVCWTVKWRQEHF